MAGAGRVQRTWRSAAARRVLQLAGTASSVENAVAKLAEGYLQGVTCPPTNLDAVRHKLGVELSESADVIGSGALLRDEGGFRILYSSDLSPQRRRFTIAHELGHVIVDVAGRGGPRHGKELERLCDLFATEILMPKQVFLASASCDVGIDEVFRLARCFETSLTSTTIRYAELLRVSAFEVDKAQIVWGKGLVRKGSFRQLDDTLRRIIEKALKGRPGKEEVYLSTNGNVRLWIVEYHPYGKSGRALILLYPPGRGSRDTALSVSSTQE